MPGLIERNNGQRVISLTANLHGITLGEPRPNSPPPSRAPELPQRRHRQLPRPDPRLGTNQLGPATGLLLAILVIFLLLAANFQSIRLASGNHADRSRECYAAFC